MSAVLGVVAGRSPVAFDPERATRKVIRPRGDTLLSRIGDLYIHMLAVGVVSLYAIGVLNVFNAAAKDGLGGSLIRGSYSVVPAEIGLIAVFGALGVGGYWLAGRLGPLAVAANQKHWWYSLQVDREPLLARNAYRSTLAASAAGSIVMLPVAILGGGGALHIGAGILAGAMTGAAVLSLAALAQVRRSSGGPASGGPASAGTVEVGPTAVRSWPLAVAALGLGIVLFYVVEGQWLFLLLPTFVLLAAWLGMKGKLSKVRTAALAKAGSTRGHMEAAIRMLDTAELSASLCRVSKRSLVKLPGTPSTAIGALLHAEATVLARQPNRLWRWVLGLAVVPLAGLIQNFDSPIVLLPLLAAAAIFSATAVAGPLWQLRLAPSLDALLPISRTTSRWVHVALPVILMVLWATVVSGFFVLAGGFRPELLVLGAAAGGGLGAGMLRRAFRQPEDLTKLSFLMHLGRSGPAMLGSRIRGYVMSLFGMLPLALGMLFNAPEVLVLPALALNAVLLAVGVLAADQP